MQPIRIVTAAITAGAVLVAVGFGGPPAGAAVTSRGAATGGGAATAAVLPRPDHVVILVEENHAYSQINGTASYLTSLADTGARFTQSFALTHPSQPNYLALFSGSAQGVTSDSCPHTYSGANQGSELIAAGLSFAGFSESMPSDGYTGCTSGAYARKHNPWVDFANVPASANLRLSRFPTDYTTLPTVSIVVPNLNNDMHDGSIATGDAWAKTTIDPYAQWAKTHNSLLIVTFDEDDSAHGNQIFTVFYGQPVATGTYPEQVTHASVLATIEGLYGIPCTASACTTSAITDTWQ